MRLTDEEEMELKRARTELTKKIIIASISLLFILCVIIIVIILYKINNPTTITTTIDGVAITGFDEIVDFQTNEKGEVELYIPIRKFADYLNAANSEFGYTTFNGDYDPKTEDETKCYVSRDSCEVAIFTEGSKTVYKVNLQNSSTEYEECTIDKSIFESNGVLYASQDGIEKGYNVQITYNDKKKTIQIYTMDYLIQAHTAKLAQTTIANYGTLTIYEKSYSNYKSVFDDLLIVQSSTTGKYGIVKTSDYTSFVLEPQYDSISFIRESSSFIVESNGKVGLFSEDGKRKIDMIYDSITSMGENSGLYVVQSSKTYGVVDEEGKIIIYPEYNAIGISISSYSYNGIKNGYILLDSVIPVQQDKLWALYDKTGKMLTDGFLYTSIGCSSVKTGNNIYPLLVIEEEDAIIVQDEDKKYSCINTKGDLILSMGFIFDQMYIKLSNGENSYWMTYNSNDYEIKKYID